MLGPSGSGKTTCLRMIAGFERPTEGTIELGGSDVSRLAPYQRDVNTVFQDYALFPHMDVRENVEYGLMVKKVPKADRKQRVTEALEMVRLEEFGRRKPAALSGGQRQRVALARALVNRPKVLLLDEPLGALDLKLRQAMQIELKAIQRQVGLTFIYVTHDQEEALTMSDRLAVFNRGRIEQIGSPAEVYERPSTGCGAAMQLAHERRAGAKPSSRSSSLSSRGIASIALPAPGPRLVPGSRTRTARCAWWWDRPPSCGRRDGRSVERMVGFSWPARVGASVSCGWSAARRSVDGFERGCGRRGRLPLAWIPGALQRPTASPGAAPGGAATTEDGSTPERVRAKTRFCPRDERVALLRAIMRHGQRQLAASLGGRHDRRGLGCSLARTLRLLREEPEPGPPPDRGMPRPRADDVPDHDRGDLDAPQDAGRQPAGVALVGGVSDQVPALLERIRERHEDPLRVLHDRGQVVRDEVAEGDRHEPRTDRGHADTSCRPQARARSRAEEAGRIVPVSTSGNPKVSEAASATRRHR